jgi:putative transposase
MRIVDAVPKKVMRVVGKLEFADLTRQARVRRDWLEWHAKRGGNVTLTCRHFGISRSTFYRWHKRYDPMSPKTLEDRSSVPKGRRQPSWGTKELETVKRVREQYPSWGKDKLAEVLGREELVMSVSMVGRVLTHLKQTRQLVEPPRFGVTTRRRRRKRIYAVRKPKEYQPRQPGDIVQIDTLDVRPLPNVIRKQFSAIDVVSRYSVLDVHSQATARLAASFLDTLLTRAPFPIRAIQIDNGSEFMAEFEDACRDKQLRLFVLPPRSPKLNGCVERSQRTHTQEFWELCTADTDLASLRSELLVWEHTYNHVRPHQALGYLTPSQYLAQSPPQHAPMPSTL